MNKGVEILLERMKSNPEEFVPQYDGGTTKWGNVIGHLQTYLDKEDSKALDDAWRETVIQNMQEKFTQAVMKELLDPKSEVSGITASPYQSATGLAGATQGGYSGGSGLSQLFNNGTGLALANTSNATATLSAAGNLTTASLTLGKTQLQEQQLQQLLAMKMQVEADRLKAEQKKHETLVGKLYNYLGSNK